MSQPRILVAPNSYKETFTAPDVAKAMADGVREVGAMPVTMPLSDGGDGLLDVMEVSGALRGGTTNREVAGPLGDPVTVRFGWLDKYTAIIESRLAVGLSLVPLGQRNPWKTSTRGLGELIALAASKAHTVVVGLGGSATMDGGVDMARAWGWRPLDGKGQPTPLGGEGLVSLRTMTRGSGPAVHLRVLADVQNPLLGSGGAAVYGQQKGATPSVVRVLETGLSNLVAVLGNQAMVVAARPGSGAAGGLGFGLQYFGNGQLVSGAEWVLDRLGFEERLRTVAGVLTGEGAFDATSLAGKTPGSVIRRALDASIPVALLAPRASGVHEGCHVETGGGKWDLDDVRSRAVSAVRVLLSLPPR